MSNDVLDPCGFDAVPDIGPYLFRRDAEGERKRAEAKEARAAAFDRWRAMWPACPCHGDVFAAWEAAAEEDKRRREDEAARKLLRARWLEADVPERVMRTLGATPEQTTAMQAAAKFLAGDATFLVLVGGTGTGKTTAGVEALMRLSKPSTGMFIQASRCGQLGLFSDEDKAVLGDMRRVACLLIDDLGSEFLSENSVWRGLVDGILDARYSGMLRTIITTNLDFPALAERYGRRVADRLRHDSVFAACGAKSLRTPRGAP